MAKKEFETGSLREQYDIGQGVGLSWEHLDALQRESGISEEVIENRRYRTVSTRSDLRTLGFSDSQAPVPVLLMPIWDVDGEIANYQARPDTPRIVRGKAVKYEMPAGSRMVLDVHPKSRRGSRPCPAQR